MSTQTLKAFREYVGEHEAVRTRTIQLIAEDADLGGVAELATAHGFEVSEDDLEDFLIDPGDELFDWEEEMAVEAAGGNNKNDLRRRRVDVRRRSSSFANCNPLCDARLKTAITPAGTSPSGIPRYTFTYRDDPTATRYHGAMAQDLLQTHPEAVVTDESGYYRVDYALIDVDFHAAWPAFLTRCRAKRREAPVVSAWRGPEGTAGVLTVRQSARREHASKTRGDPKL